MLLLAIVVLARQGSLYQAIFPKPTGSNGFEEYLQAADAIATPEFVAYNQCVPKSGFAAACPAVAINDLKVFQRSADSDDVVALRAKLKDLDLSQLCVGEAQRFRGALELVKLGNSKISIRPDNPDPKLITDGDPEFLGIVNLGLRSAYAGFAIGNSRQATEDLLTTLVFADRVGRPDVAYLGWGGRAAVLDVFADRIDQLSLPDCEAVQDAVSNLLLEVPSNVEDAKHKLAGWKKYIGEYVTYFVQHGSEDRLKAIPQAYGLTNDLAKLSPDEVKQVILDASSLVDSASGQVEEFYKAPEHDWLGTPPNDLFAQGVDVASHSLAFRVAWQTKPPLFNSLHSLQLAEMIARTRMRLLVIHARIRAFRWRNGGLPPSLKVLGDDSPVDALTGADFQYALQPNGSYDLYSKGIEQTGPIRLSGAQRKAPANPVAGLP